MTSPASAVSLENLVADAQALVDAVVTSGERYILGIAGPPGAGKSTVAAALEERLRDHAVVVPMDGFHLANSVLEERGLSSRKGAPDTFDVEGYKALLRRLRGANDVVLAPRFDRGAEAPVANAIAVAPDVPLVITEGNYLLHDQHGWQGVQPLLDGVWFLDVPEDEVQRRLIARRLRHGHAEDAARAWVRDVDLPNYAVVEAGKARADRIICLR